MRFSERLFAGGFPVALEVTPPQKELPAVLLRRARLLGPWATAVNVIQRPGRQTSLAACVALRAAGMEPVWHLVTRGHSREQLEADLAAAREGGIGHVLVIRGDHGGADVAGGPTIRETIALVRAALPGACVGATANQYAADQEAVLKNLLPKLAAGACYIQTQPVFDPAELRPLVDAVRERSPGTRVVAMAMPIVSEDAFEKVQARLGIALPEALRSRIAAGSEGAWAAFDETVAGLRACGFVDGLAVMTFEMDAPPGMGERIAQALERAGCAPGDPRPETRDPRTGSHKEG